MEGGGGVVGVKAKIRELTILNNTFSGCESKEGVAFISMFVLLSLH